MPLFYRKYFVVSYNVIESLVDLVVVFGVIVPLEILQILQNLQSKKTGKCLSDTKPDARATTHRHH